MTRLRDEALARMRQDHAHMAYLIRRIDGSCAKETDARGCDHCRPERYFACRGNVDDLVRNLVEVTLKHNAVETLIMREYSPAGHQRDHLLDHVRIARRMHDIRLVLAQEGNCVVAIEGIDQVLAAIEAHNASYDAALEGYLAATP